MDSVPADLRSKIVPWYVEEKRSAEDICARLAEAGHELTPYYIYRYLLFNGVEPRRGGNRRSRVDAPGREMADLLDYGFTSRQIAQWYSVSHMTVLLRSREHRAQ